jgi:hypothetical protein
MTDFAVKVQAGIKLLDEQEPGWRAKIDKDSLDLGSCSVCVLGQVFGDYEEGLEMLDLGTGSSYAYGFNTNSADMQALTAAWKEALGKNNVLVEKDDVYSDRYGYAVKVIQTHIVDGISAYVVQAGTVSGKSFTPYSNGKEITVLTKASFEPGGAYYIKLDTSALVVRAGMFLANDLGETFYAVSSSEVRPLKDGAFAQWLSTINQKGLREMTTPNGDKFSKTLIKSAL